MTDDEALRLEAGDRLVGVVNGRLAVLEVAWKPEYRALGHVLVHVRRVGKTMGGYRFPPVHRPSDELQRLPRPDAPAFHVAADWLDENGEPMAAHKLRRAFPLGGGG